MCVCVCVRVCVCVCVCVKKALPVNRKHIHSAHSISCKSPRVAMKRNRRALHLSCSAHHTRSTDAISLALHTHARTCVCAQTSRFQTFVPASEGGFVLPEAKSSVSWKSRYSLLIGTDTGPGSLTKSGYPRQAREWLRGTPMSDSKVVFSGEADDVSVRASCYYDKGTTSVTPFPFIC
jgi:hypothetical protein